MKKICKLIFALLLGLAIAVCDLNSYAYAFEDEELLAVEEFNPEEVQEELIAEEEIPGEFTEEFTEEFTNEEDITAEEEIWSDDTPDEEEEPEELFSEELFELQTASLASGSVKLVATGNCGVLSGTDYGDNLVYELYQNDDAGKTCVLKITGTGEMGPNCNAIWKKLYSEFKTGLWTIELTEGIADIGAYAFKDCSYIVNGTLELPESLVTIGAYAFYGCTKLTGELVIPERVELIDSHAFDGCSGFSPLPMDIPESTLTIGTRAFNGCKFPSYYIPGSVTRLGTPKTSSTDAFSYPFPTKVGNTPVTIYVLKDTYGYEWGEDSRQYGYNIELGQKKYRIFYDVNCSDGSVSPSIQVVYEERALGEMSVPVRAGYTFDGWYTDAVAGELITSEDICYEDIYAYAHWTTNKYEVSFDGQGGKGSLFSRNINYDSVYGPLPTVTRENYDFVGWFTDPEGGDEITEDTILRIPRDHTLYAHWLGIPMTVTFDKLAGVGEAEDRTVYYDSPYGTLPVLTKEHCEFMGWYTDMNGGVEVTADTHVSSLTDHTLYARWKGVDVTVYFDANGGKGFFPALAAMYGAAYGELPEATRDDKDFDGWYTELDGGVKITSTSIVENTEMHVLYAHWTHKHVNVTFKTNGGEALLPIKVECEAPYGTLPVPVRYGYDFDGWYNTATGGSLITEDTTVDNLFDHVLYARWKPKTGIKVSFDKGPGEGETDDIFVTFASTYGYGGTFPTVTREDYEFAGWYTEEDGGEHILLTTIVSREEDHTLYARWRGKPLKVTFETGEIAGKRETKTVYYDDYFGSMPTPTKYGCTFVGWYTEETGGEQIESTTKVTASEDLTLYAHWVNKVCTVTYVLNDGTNDPSNPVSYTKSDNTIVLKNPTKLGCTFAGWYVNPRMYPADKITQISRGMAEDLTLYAKWTTNTYWIRYVMGIAAVNPNANKTYYRVPESIGPMEYTLKAPTQKGYVFEGWYTDKEFTQPIEKIDGTFEGNITLYAKWRGATFYIRYHAPDAIAGYENTTMHQYNNKDSYLADGSGFFREGYHVDRWYINPAGYGWFILPGANYNNVIIPEEGQIIDVYAGWRFNNYYISYEKNGADIGNQYKYRYFYGYNAIIPACVYRKTGYKFVGWNTKPDGSGTMYQPGQIISDGLTVYNEDTVSLYAQWVPINYTIQLISQIPNLRTMAPVQMTYDAPSTLPDCEYVRDGFHFKNWKSINYINGAIREYNAGETTVINALVWDGLSTYFKAVWEYNVSFDANCPDAVGTMTDITVNADISNQLPQNAYTREGYTFWGWSKNPDAIFPSWVDKGYIWNIGDSTLYAVWRKK